MAAAAAAATSLSSFYGATAASTSGIMDLNPGNSYELAALAMKPDILGPDTRLYLGNIHVSIDEAALKTVLEQFGPTDSIKIHRDHLGNSKGFAFVKYMRHEHATVAMSALSGMELAGKANTTMIIIVIMII